VDRRFGSAFGALDFAAGAAFWAAAAFAAAAPFCEKSTLSS
jgi:hypothetical protein